MGQEELAQALGTTQANVSRMERGERRLSLETLKALAKILDCPLSFLVGEEIAPPAPRGRKSDAEALFDELARKHPEVGLHLRSLAKARHELTEEDWNFLVTHLKLALGYVDASLKARRSEGSF
jgi:transcriptional regulator with XRE-family HTH domain